MYVCMYIPLLTSNFTYIGGGKRVTGNARYLWLETIIFDKLKSSLYVTQLVGGRALRARIVVCNVYIHIWVLASTLQGCLPAPKYVYMAIKLYTEIREFQDFTVERPKKLEACHLAW